MESVTGFRELALRQAISQLQSDLASARQELAASQEQLATAWKKAQSELATAKQRVKVLERATSMSQQGLAEVHLRNEARLAKRITELETQLAESRERERKAIDILNQIACRCTSELQDRSGQHVARVPGSRQWRDALYSIRLQIESMQPSQASAEDER